MNTTNTFRCSSIALLLTCNSLALFAQSNPVTAGDNIFLLGVGTGGPWSIRFDQTSATPLFQLNYEHALAEVPGAGVVGLGGYVGYKSLRHKSTLDPNSYFYYDQRYSVVPIGLRITTHYNLGLEKLDTYGGVGGGMNLVKRTLAEQAPGGSLFTDDDDVKSHFAYSLYVGARYTVTNQFGLWAELSYGNAWVNFGASITL